jgi:glycosyltransferase involved in cell wall biosynthesis
MPRRILFVAWAPFFSGAERALLLTLRSLDPARYAPYVLAGTDGDFTAQVRALGIPCRVAALSPLDRRRPIAALAWSAAVLASAVRYRVSLIHTNEVPSFQAAGYVARLIGAPCVTHVRFPDSRQGYEWFLRPGFSRALFVSHALLAAAMHEAPDVFERRSDVLHDGVEPQAAWSADQTAACRRELGLPTDRSIVGMAGQIAEVKGIWDFVEAARLLCAGNADACFVVLGDDLKTQGRTRRAMEERVAALGLSERFRFLGFRSDAPRVVQAFDIVAVPSHVEPLGNATLEAMAAGRPVVGSRVGGIPEMVVDGTTGLLVPPSSPAELAGAIGALVRDGARRSQMSLAARGRASETFSMEAHGRRLQSHYDQLCSPAALKVGTGSAVA